MRAQLTEINMQYSWAAIDGRCITPALSESAAAAEDEAPVTAKDAAYRGTVRQWSHSCGQNRAWRCVITTLRPIDRHV